MTTEETTLSPKEVRTEDTNADAGRELSDLLTALAQEQLPERELLAERAYIAQPIQPEMSVKAPRKKPHILLRIPLQILSFAVALALFVTTLAGALVLDLQTLTSSGGIKQLIDAAMDTLISAPAKVTREPSHISPMSSRTPRYDETDATGLPEGSFSVIIDENGNAVIVDANGNIIDSEMGDYVYVDENGNLVIGDVDIDLGDMPEDILTGEDGTESIGDLIDWLYEEIENAVGEELPITEEDVMTFIEKSTVSDYLSDKLTGFTDDYLNGTSNTNISADEILDLLEENKELLKEHLHFELTPDVKEELQGSLEEIVQESGINEVIREEVFGTVDEMLEETTDSLGVDMEDIRAGLQLLASGSMRSLFIIINVVLLLLLCLLNFYNVPAGLTWAAFPCILSGGLLSLPLVVMGSVTVEGGTSIVSLLSSFADLFKPIHFGLLAIGVGLLVISIVWRVIRSARNAK